MDVIEQFRHLTSRTGPKPWLTAGRALGHDLYVERVFSYSGMEYVDLGGVVLFPSETVSFQVGRLVWSLFGFERWKWASEQVKTLAREDGNWVTVDETEGLPRTIRVRDVLKDGTPGVSDCLVYCSLSDYKPTGLDDRLGWESDGRFTVRTRTDEAGADKLLKTGVYWCMSQ